MFGPVQELVEEGVEDQLGLHAEQVERARAVLLEERAGRAPVLALHDLLLVARAVLRVGVPPTHALDHRLLARAHGREVELRDPAAHGGVGEGVQPVGGLDDVGVGVVNAAVLDVRHLEPSGRRAAASIQLRPARPSGDKPVGRRLRRLRARRSEASGEASAGIRAPG